MNFEFNEKQKKVIELCKELSKDFATRADEHDKNRTAPEENYQKVKGNRLHGVVILVSYGGLGIGFLGYVASIIEIAKGCAVTANSFNKHANATGAIMQQADKSEDI